MAVPHPSPAARPGDPPPRPHLREEVDALGERLARISAAAVTLRAMAADARSDVGQDALVDLLDQLERDLGLAARSAAQLRGRAAHDSDRRGDGA